MKESHPGPSRRQFLAGLVAGAAGTEAVRRVADMPDTALEAASQEVLDVQSFCDDEDAGFGEGDYEMISTEGVDGFERGPLHRPDTFRRFLEQFNRESGNNVQFEALQTGSNMVLVVNVNGFRVPFELFAQTPREEEVTTITYGWFREKLKDFLRTVV